MKSTPALVPPLGVRIHTDTVPRGKRVRARARWTDPVSGIRISRSITVDSEAFANEFFSVLRSQVSADLDPFITLTDHSDQIGDRFLRGVDMTSTASGYRAGLRLRALPSLGRLRIRDITTGIVDRSIDSWEIKHSRSTLKNTIASLTRVLDEAVRDEINNPKSSERPGASTVSDARGTTARTTCSITHRCRTDRCRMRRDSPELRRPHHAQRISCGAHFRSRRAHR